MSPRRKLDDALLDAAQALRGVADSVSDDRDDCRPARGRDCFGSSRELVRLGEALLAAVEVVREVVKARQEEPDCDDVPRELFCESGGAAPMPPYPPYPPHAPHPPFPPYPPYPPVIVLGGGGCTCCQGAAALAPVMPPSAVAQPPASPAPPPTLPPPPPVPSTIQPPDIMLISAASTGAASFPNPAALPDVESLLDVGESAAALVHRTLPTPAGGPGE